MVIQCCVCHSVREAGTWQKKAVKDGQQISHTYCPHCLEKASSNTVLTRERTLALT